MSTQVELVVDAHATIGEGSLWNSAGQVLYWVDIMGCKLHVHDPSGDPDRVTDLGQPVGTVVVRASGGLMLALKDGFARLRSGQRGAGPSCTIRKPTCRRTASTTASAIPPGASGPAPWPSIR